MAMYSQKRDKFVNSADSTYSVEGPKCCVIYSVNKLFINEVAAARHRLILGQHGDTACADLLEAYLDKYPPILNSCLMNMLDFQGAGVSGIKNQEKISKIYPH